MARATPWQLGAGRAAAADLQKPRPGRRSCGGIGGRWGGHRSVRRSFGRQRVAAGKSRWVSGRGEAALCLLQRRSYGWAQGALMACTCDYRPGGGALASPAPRSGCVRAPLPFRHVPLRDGGVCRSGLF